MANYEKRSCLDGRVAYGPENTNGTGEVYLNADNLGRWLDLREVAELVRCLTQAMMDAQANKKLIRSRVQQENQ